MHNIDYLYIVIFNMYIKYYMYIHTQNKLHNKFSTEFIHIKCSENIDITFFICKMYFIYK